ncbi:hypothetical protein ABZ671_16790 [Micromonospora sp. NPDC006766]|uniref:hypothetical protein n=1 Tax=Micromonospora sp. NPDC006766 TaxID=3154778 RepID=UPI0033CF52B9
MTTSSPHDAVPDRTSTGAPTGDGQVDPVTPLTPNGKSDSSSAKTTITGHVAGFIAQVTKTQGEV